MCCYDPYTARSSFFSRLSPLMNNEIYPQSHRNPATHRIPEKMLASTPLNSLQSGGAQREPPHHIVSSIHYVHSLPNQRLTQVGIHAYM